MWTAITRRKIPTTYRIAAISVIGKSMEPPARTLPRPVCLGFGRIYPYLSSAYPHPSSPPPPQAIFILALPHQLPAGQPGDRPTRAIALGRAMLLTSTPRANQAAPCSALTSRPCPPSSQPSRIFARSTNEGLTRMACVWVRRQQPKAASWPPCPGVPGSAHSSLAGFRTAMAANNLS